MDISKKQPKTVAFILFPGFALTSFSLAIEALSVANQLSEQSMYDYQLFSAEPDLSNVISSNKVPVSVSGQLTNCTTVDRVFICAYRNASQYNNKVVIHHLRRLYNQGSEFAALSSASFILARAGLLENRNCTVFQDHINTFKELFPKIRVQENIFTVDGPIFTCAGGMTALDMLLYIIAMDHGKDFSQKVSEIFLQDRIRSLEETQKMNHYIALRTKSPILGAAVEIMDKHLETPLKIQQIAEKIGTTPRTLEKVFNRFANASPSHYYQNLRLEQAKALIENTYLPFSAVAQATGFTSQSYFSKCFRRTFNITPTQLRKTKLL